MSTMVDTRMSVGDIMSTLGFPYKFNCFPNDLPPGVLMISSQCIEHPQCTHDIPPLYS